MNARKNIIVSGILLAILVIAVVFVWNRTQLTQTNLLDLLPINPTSKNITWSYVSYNFTLPVKNLTPTTQGMLVNLETTNNTIPTFLLKNTTLLMAYDSSKKLYYKTTFASLTKGSTLSIIADYNLLQKTWTVRQVYIK